jgi:MATE family multidrug resistance protein
MLPRMTLSGTIIAANKTRSRGLWREELIDTIKLALPIALTQLGQIAMMTTDLALIGRLGETAVAAAALGQIVMFVGFVIGLGLVSAVAPLAAQAFGARNPRIVRRALRVGLWAALMFGIPFAFVQFHGGSLLLLAGQDERSAALAQRYLDGLGWSLVPAWWFIAIRNFMSAVNRPEPALWITLVAIPTNALIAYSLIHGAFGMPRLDLLGAGVGTTTVNLGMCIAAIWICYARRPFKKYQVLGKFWRFDKFLFAKLVILGAPISASFLLEFGLFAAAGLLMGWIGTTALAAHQIAIQVASVMFMVPFGISMAATVRVGQAVGRRDAPGARRAGFVALALGAMFMAAMTLLVVLTRDTIPLLFLNSSPGTAATIELTSKLLLLGACFFIFDGIQTIGAGALRGFNDTRIPLLFSAFSFWCVGFTSAYALAFWVNLGAPGIWIGLTLGLVTFATLLVWRFYRLGGRRDLPALVTAPSIHTI